MFHPLVFSAQAFPVGYRTKDTGAEQAIPLRFKSAVIDGLRLGHFTVRPAPNFFRRCQADTDGIEIGDRVYQVKGARTIQGIPRLPAAVTLPPAAPETQWPVMSGQWPLFSRPDCSGAWQSASCPPKILRDSAASGQPGFTGHSAALCASPPPLWPSASFPWLCSAPR